LGTIVNVLSATDRGDVVILRDVRLAVRYTATAALALSVTDDRPRTGRPCEGDGNRSR